LRARYFADDINLQVLKYFIWLCWIESSVFF